MLLMFREFIANYIPVSYKEKEWVNDCKLGRENSSGISHILSFDQPSLITQMKHRRQAYQICL